MAKRSLKATRGHYAPLAANPEYVLASQHALKLYSLNAVYSFIPKNGCSTMRLTLALENGAISDPADFNWIHKNNGTFRASLEDILRADYTFVILRDPFARIASCFIDKFVSKEREAWLFYEDVTNRRTDIDNLSFSEFLHEIARNENLRANIHWRPQSDFLLYDDYDNYFCLEDFAAAESKFLSLGVPIADARPLTQHSSKRLTQDGSRNYSDVPIKELYSLKTSGIVPTYRSLYHDELIDLARESYAADFELYAERIGMPVLF